MPNVKSAIKRVRTNEKRRLRNRAGKMALKTVLKRAGAVAESGDIEKLKKATQEALSAIGKTKSKGVINRRRAARLQSRIQKRLNKATAPAASATAGDAPDATQPTA